MSAEGLTVCALCGSAFQPGGATCVERGCPFAGAGCRTLDCPHCGYAVPDELQSRLARWVRRLFAPAAVEAGPSTLADLRPGEDGVLDGILGDPALAARLTAQGLAPGVAVHLVQRSPSYVIEVGETTLALERSVAQIIRVRAHH
jgi:DtxR family transcriptional regulator, Mn-dependent transcriptional regulator